MSLGVKLVDAVDCSVNTASNALKLASNMAKKTLELATFGNIQPKYHLLEFRNQANREAAASLSLAT